MSMLLAAVLLSSAPAVEQPLPELTEWTTRPRARFGIGYWAGADAGRLPIPMIGGSLTLGVQLNERVAFYGLLEGNMSLGALVFISGALAELSLTPWLALGAGLGCASSTYQERNLIPIEKALAVGVPMRLTVSFGRSVPLGDARNRFFAAVDGFAGTGVMRERLGAFTGMVGLSVGWQLM